MTTETQPPRFLLTQLNLTCNLRCQHCHLWRNHDNDRKIDQGADLRARAIREFAELNPRGTVVSCSGEPLVEPRHYFDMCRAARESGLTSLSVLNGTLVDTQDQADDLLTRGADELSFSLDHPREEAHDMQRGLRGSYLKTLRCLEMLLDARRRLGLSRKIYVMLLVSNVSYRDIAEAYDLILNRVGADKLKLNFLQPTFAQYHGKDTYWDLHTRNIDVEWLMEEIDRCEARYALDFNPRWKANVRCYANSLAEYHRGGPMETSEALCDSFDRNILLELDGQLRLCFHPEFPSLMKYQKPGDLRRFWYSEETAQLRERMRACRKFCGICHTFKREPATREAARRCLGIEQNSH
jgi:MoaA/NifB/PqqE/SkfB family radical SAM enzyme